MKSIRFPLHDIQEVFRGRYRCPRCEGVGTWNPHGGLIDARRDLRRVRRWMCKWCGLYRGPEGWREVCIDMTITHESLGLPGGGSGVWRLDDECPPGSMTTKEAAESVLGGPTNPWRY